MSLEVTVPAEHLGDVLGSVSVRRGLVVRLEAVGDTQVVRAEVPLGELFGYVTDLRSMSQGRGTQVMEFSHYAPAPAAVTAQVISGGRSV